MIPKHTADTRVLIDQIVEATETQVRAILPDLVKAVLKDELGDWMTEVVETVNELEARIDVM